MDPPSLTPFPGEPPQVVVHDAREACPYLEGRTARLPLRLPLAPLTPEHLDASLAAGDRRHGRFLYRTACPGCTACEPIRVDVGAFRPSRSQRRALARGDRELELEVGRPRLSAERVELYRRHKAGRGLDRGDRPAITPAGYARFLVDRCCPAIELRFRRAGRLVGIAVSDVGESALSAVYCSFDPDLPRLSIGTYSIVKQLEIARRRGLDWLYLGFYVEGNRHMEYKARFRPHERKIGGEWVRFEGS